MMLRCRRPKRRRDQSTLAERAGIFTFSLIHHQQLPNPTRWQNSSPSLHLKYVPPIDFYPSSPPTPDLPPVPGGAPTSSFTPAAPPATPSVSEDLALRGPERPRFHRALLRGAAKIQFLNLKTSLRSLNYSSATDAAVLFAPLM